MRIPNDLKVVVAVIMVVFIVITLTYIGSDIGFTQDMQDDFVAILPGLSIFVVGAFALAVIGSSVFAIAGFGVMGLGVAVLVEEMHTVEIMIPDILTTSFTLGDLQITVLVSFILIGGVVSGIASRSRW